ncbi:MAG: hypothetical protein KDC98_01595 [Planctomycetes bacterium]|nr:hypothetical protein [Planctomycetota bacterium]
MTAAGIGPIEDVLMPGSHCSFASKRGTVPFVLSLCLPVSVANAQHPVLAPTSDTTITVGSGALHYSSILIPAGVTVRFAAPGLGGYTPGTPAVVFCDGDAIVHGMMSVSGEIAAAYPAGWVTTGAGAPGYVCGSGASFNPPQGGSHAGAYGSVIPFSLDGGSFGGALAQYPWCLGGTPTVVWGGTGGGTLALLAQGRIEVDGTVAADGLHYGSVTGSISPGGGSGGSILLSGAGGVTILPTGRVTARGGTALNAHPTTVGAPGYIRLDAWGTAPIIQGTVDPPPTTLELPHLRARTQLRIGSTWLLDVLAPENAPIYVAASLLPGPGTPTPFGSLGLDLPTAANLAVTSAQPSHDPIATVPWPVPNAPFLIGLQLWVQALAIPPTLPPRLSNTLHATVQ